MRDIKPNFGRKNIERLPVGPTPEWKPRSIAKSPRLTGAAVPVSRIEATAPAQEEPLPAEQVRPLFYKKPRPAVRLGGRERMIMAVLLGAAGVTAVLGAMLFLPKASIKLVLRTAPLLVDEVLTVSQVEGSGNVIPGKAFVREVSVEGVSPVKSTEVIGGKATGTVKIINRTFDEQSIKGKSRLVTADGQLFYFGEKGVTVPAASGGSLSSVSVQIEAAESGDKGNIEPQRLDFAALDENSRKLVYAEATEKFSGGSGDTVPVVKDSDIQEAKLEAGKQAQRQVESGIMAELPEGWSLFSESWSAELEDFTANRKPGDREADISYTAKGKIKVMAYEKAALEERLQNALNSRLNEDYMLFPGAISFTKELGKANWDAGEAEMKVRVTHTTVPELSVEGLRQKMANQSAEEAQQYLTGLTGVRSASVELWPFWVRSIPRIEKRITVDLQPERQP